MSRTPSNTTRRQLVAIALGLASLLAGCGPATVDRGAESARADAIARQFLDERALSLPEMRALADELIELGTSHGDDGIRARGLTRTAYIELLSATWSNDWRARLRRAGELAEGRGDQAEVDLRLYRGLMRGRWLGDFDGGVEDLRIAIQLATQLRSDEFLCRAYDHASELHRYRGEHILAAQSAHRALQIAEGLDQPDLIENALYSTVAAIGSGSLPHPRRAHYVEQLQTLGELDPRLLATLEDRQKAESELRALLATPLPENQPLLTADRARTLLALGFLLRSEGRLEEALEAARSAETLHARTSDRDGEIHAALLRVDLESILGLPPEGLERVVQKIEEVDLLVPAETLTRIYERLGRFEEAEEWSRIGRDQEHEERSSADIQVELAARDYWRAETQSRQLADGRLALQREFARDHQIWLAGGSVLALVLLLWRYRLKAQMLAALHREIEQREREQAKNAALLQELAQSNKLEAVGTLAAGVAHDFNNVLTAVIGFARLEAVEARDESPNLRAILDASHIAAQTSRDLLTFARKSDGTYAPVDLTRLVERSFDFIGRLLPSSTALTHSVPGGPALWTVGDESKLRQALINLVLNARDAVDARGQVHIALRADPESSEHALLEVADEGVGMSPNVLSQVFDPFFTTKARTKGTGLGMSIVRGIVEDHGGTIDVESKPGEGTRISIRLPLGEPGSAESLGSRAPERGKGRLVLLVEDDSAVRMMVRLVLVNAGYRVSECHRADEARRAFQSQSSDYYAAILDVDLPGGSGHQVRAELRALAPELPIVMTSGLVLDGTIDDCVALPKPFSPTEVLEALDHAAAERGFARL